jgi:hypothetical protein
MKTQEERIVEALESIAKSLEKFVTEGINIYDHQIDNTDLN